MEKVNQAIALLREANAELKQMGFRITSDIKIVPYNGCIGDCSKSDEKSDES